MVIIIPIQSCEEISAQNIHSDQSLYDLENLVRTHQSIFLYLCNHQETQMLIKPISYWLLGNTKMPIETISKLNIYRIDQRPKQEAKSKIEAD